MGVREMRDGRRPPSCADGRDPGAIGAALRPRGKSRAREQERSPSRDCSMEPEIG